MPRYNVQESELSIDDKLIKAMLEYDHSISTKELAALAGISWNTAKKHLDKLLEKKWVEKIEKGRKEKWRVIERKY